MKKPSLSRDNAEVSCARASFFGARVGRSSCEACRFKRVIEKVVSYEWRRFSLLGGERSRRESEKRNKSNEIVVALFKFVLLQVLRVWEKITIRARGAPLRL